MKKHNTYKVKYILILILIFTGIGLAIFSKSWIILVIFFILLLFQIKSNQESWSFDFDNEEIISIEKPDKYGLLKDEIHELKILFSKHENHYKDIKSFLEEAINPKDKIQTDSPNTSETMKVLKNVAEIIPYVEKRQTQFATSEDLSLYYSQKLIDTLESFGLELINQKTTFDIKLHEVSPSRWIPENSDITKIIRPGLKKGNRVYVKAKVIV